MGNKGHNKPENDVTHHEERRSTTVTIRGVDKNLYDQFVGLTKIWGRNTGHVFNHLISNYRKGHPLMPPRMKRHTSDKNLQIEIIEGIEELRISKKDLLEAGNNVKYYFRSINNLVFSEDCDNQVLLNHVHRIRNCNVKMPETVSNLLFYSIVRQRIPLDITKEDLKDITIRNVVKENYDEFITACQLNGQKVGDAVNELLWGFVPEMEAFQILIHEINTNPHDGLVVTLLNNLEVTKADLNAIKDKKILFHRIKKLVFAPDIDKDVFVNTVVGIYNCDEVILPETVPKLLRLSRVKKYPG